MRRARGHGTTWGPATLIAVLAGVLVTAGPSPAQVPRTTKLISTAGANTPVDFVGASADGSRVFFQTAEALPGTGDTDGATDLYERRSDGALRLISTGGADLPVEFEGVSADGTRVFFRTQEAIPATGDTDAARDIYERRADGALRLVTPGTANTDATFAGASTDGSRVFFTTGEALPGTGDANAVIDVYEARADGGLMLISSGAPGGRGDGAAFAGASDDGTRVFFTTAEAIPGTGDASTGLDVYERRADGALRLISTGSSPIGATFAGAATDGSRVFFETTQAIPGTGDGNAALDIYERRADGALRLISTGGSELPASFAGASADGARVVFQTAEAIPGTGDTDAATDVYERQADGTLRLVTTSGANAPAEFAASSADGTRVFFQTAEAIPGTGDADGAADVYERRADGALRLITTNGSSAPAEFAGASVDGTRVFFQTAEAIPGTGDADTATDTYERRADGALELITAGSANTPTGFGGASADGTRVFFQTAEAIPGTGDTDAATDVYESAVAVATGPPAPPPPGADPPPARSDRSAPTARISTPRCARRLSRRACRNLRARVGSWRTLRGTVTDRAPSSGVARVEITMVRRAGRRCVAYTGRRFARVACARSTRRTVRATVSGHTWRLRVRGLRAGRYTITARAIDRAGNRQRRAATRTVRLRRG